MGKYRLIKELGRGRSGAVWLAWHLGLEEYRAVKIVSKAISGYDTFKREALFLKTLRHPGIPLVYDVEEDADNSYLIEEYLEGESLYAMVSRLGALSPQWTAVFGIQVCQLIAFMNSSENPILYLDLQPKNLMVCDLKVRLIDFDHAQFLKGRELPEERYGTIGFAAPEQFSDEPLDCRTDVYAIGALLFFMAAGKPPEREPDFSVLSSERMLTKIICGAMAKKREERYQTAEDLLEALNELPYVKEIQEQKAINSRTILLAGARSGIGTTHVALSLAGYLSQNGIQTLYREEWDAKAARNLAKARNQKADRFGIYHIGCLHIRPYYGETVVFPSLTYPVILKDIGTSWRERTSFFEADLTILICGGKWWEIEETVSAARFLRERGPLVLAVNHLSDEFRLKFPGDLSDLLAVRLPCFPNPMKVTPLAASCFDRILSRGMGDTYLWDEGKKGRRFWPVIKRKHYPG